MDTHIEALGDPLFASPVRGQRFVKPYERTIFHTSAEALDGYRKGEEPVTFTMAGPREKIFFEPKNVRAAVVTCGGLCPGLNDVIRGITMALWYGYGVRHIDGIRHGYRGLVDRYDHEVLPLSPESIRGIHDLGGTILGTSRGPQDIKEMVDTLEQRGVNMLFTIGGDGTLRGATRLAEEVARRGAHISVVGVPKTIDNDIHMVPRCFGFETAVEEARKVIAGAHVEANGAPMGIGLVRLMGRHAGFIAATAALAQPDVNVVLIPESPFDLEGPHGLLAHLKDRLARRRHAVVVVAEGAGQELFEGALELDLSGNVKLGDIGVLLKHRIQKFFDDEGMDVAIKYIDPSYVIRSVPANSNDSVYCNFLAYNAVHGAMAGLTGFLTTMWNNCYTYLPLALATSKKKSVDVTGRLWAHVLESTGQPSFREPERDK